MKDEAPSAVAAVREVIKDQQKQLREWYSTELHRLKEHRDREMNHLERALGTLNGDEEESSPTTTKRPRRSRRRRSSRASGTPAAIQERCEAILRYLVEQGEALSRNAVCSALDLSPHVAQTALRLLCDEGKVVRVGIGAGTRYRAANDRQQGNRGPVGAEGTLQGRILALIEERGWATLDELVQATNAPRKEVLRECDVLVREGEIYITQRENHSAYVRCEP